MNLEVQNLVDNELNSIWVYSLALPATEIQRIKQQLLQTILRYIELFWRESNNEIVRINKRCDIKFARILICANCALTKSIFCTFRLLENTGMEFFFLRLEKRYSFCHIDLVSLCVLCRPLLGVMKLVSLFFSLKDLYPILAKLKFV